MGKLTEDEVQQQMDSLDAWERKGERIEKLFVFYDFIRALGFVNAVAAEAEARNHHPDIVINYNKVTMSLTTHSEGGLTEKDFQLAGRIDSLNL